jgi:hypothetical protein
MSRYKFDADIHKDKKINTQISFSIYKSWMLFFINVPSLNNPGFYFDSDELEFLSFYIFYQARLLKSVPTKLNFYIHLDPEPVHAVATKSPRHGNPPSITTATVDRNNNSVSSSKSKYFPAPSVIVLD